MAGIKRFGAHVPVYRLSRDAIARAWGSRFLGGEKAVANFDEDSITMAVGAGIDCLGDLDRQNIDGLFFASTTAPYKEKQASSIVAAALDLRKDILTADFANSLRSGTTALIAAMATVKSGLAKMVLVTVADCRLGAPQGEFEQSFGDGGAAFLISDSEVAVAIEGYYAISDELMDIWRQDTDRFVRSWEDRFVQTEGYVQNIQGAVRGLLEKYNLTPKDFSRAVIYGPDLRNHASVVGSLGFDPKTQAQDTLLAQIGNTGAAAALMMLVAALEEAKPEDKILLASYGDGSDTFVLKVNNTIQGIKPQRGIKGSLHQKLMLNNYEKYVSFRQLMEREAARRPAATVSVPELRRDRKVLYGFYGYKCKNCGILQFPMERVCQKCQSKDEFEEVRLSDKKGIVFTFTKDSLIASPNPPTIMTVVELEGGCRVYLQMTDSNPDQIKLGMPVEMTFRKIHEAGGINNYFWKARPSNLGE